MKMLIPGVSVFDLRRIESDQGAVLHALKSSEESFNGFGEAYFSTVKSGVIKGWKQHQRMAMNLVVPTGRIAFCCWARDETESATIVVLAENYVRLSIEAGVWMAFKGLDVRENILLNIASIEHDPEEAINKPLDYLPFVEAAT